MFAFLGKTVARAWPVLLAGWVAVFALVVIVAPPWNDVAEDREFGFLPESVPSRRGEALLQKAFPKELLGSNVVLVVHREDRELDKKDKDFIDDVLKPGLMRIAKAEGGFADPAQPAEEASASAVRDEGQPIIVKIRTWKDEGGGVLLTSEDNKATLVILDLATELLEHRNWSTIQKIVDLLDGLRRDQKVPQGLDIGLTGSAMIGRDMTMGQADSARATERWTVALVITLLLLIYRAPLLALIPLATVAVAVQIALKLLTILGMAGVIPVFEGIQIYITVILYGTGVDYCLFLIARYREELEGGANFRDALAQAIGKVGAALTASAATVMFGIGMMTFAQFGKFHQAGAGVAFSLLISLCAVLTFGASLLRLTGRWAFWPRIPAAASRSAGGPPARTDLTENRASEPPALRDGFWDKVARALVRRPGLIWLASVAVLTPFVVVAIHNSDKLNYDLLERLPRNAPSIAGTRVLQDHFPAGATGPVTMLINNPNVDFRVEASQDKLDKLAADLRARKEAMHLADIRGVSAPLGIGTAAETLETVDASLPVPPDVFSLKPAAGALGGLGSTPMADLGSARRRQMIVRQKAVENYVSSTGDLAGHVAKFQLTFDINPLSRAGAEQLTEVESTIQHDLPEEWRQDSTIHYIGATASIRDLIAVTNSDRTRIELLVVSCVFVILLLLLRQFVESIYLIASVLFSFFATMGITYTLFRALDPQGFPGLDWKVPIFLFTILVAIGEDYNIFLMTRIHEEQKRTGDKVKGIAEALVKTGGIITSCGIIMAGTFASLLSGSLVDLQQLGFALTCGVFLDTFVVRPILVPAFLILWQGGWRRTSIQRP